MRVVLIGPAPPLRGGLAAHTAGLARCLVADGHGCDVLSYSRLYPDLLFPGTSPYARGAGELGEPIVDTLRPASWRLARDRIARARPDAVIVQWWHPVAAPALRSVLARGSGVPVIFVCHNATPHERVIGAASMSRLALARASVLLCHSHAVARRAGPMAPNARACEVVPMPILVDPNLAPPTREAARRRLGVDIRAPLAVFVGHVRRYKGVGVLLDAWRRAARPPDAVLFVAGESYLPARERERLAAAARAAGGVRVLDRFLDEDELLAVVAAADVAVLPYVGASQSGVIPLAAALGVGVIASAVGGLPEQLAAIERALPDRRDGSPVVASSLVDAGEPAALARALELALERKSASAARWGRAAAADGAVRQEGAAARGSSTTGSQWRSLVGASWAPTAAAIERLAAEGR